VDTTKTRLLRPAREILGTFHENEIIGPHRLFGPAGHAAGLCHLIVGPPDTTYNYVLNASDSDPSSISGTLTFDATTNLFTAANINAGPFGGFDFAQIDYQIPSGSGGDFIIAFQNTDFFFQLGLISDSSLLAGLGATVDATGDSITFIEAIGGGTCTENPGAGVCAGTITGSVTTTPLPAALPLFAGGLGAIGLFGRRKKRKNIAALAGA
jgi:hypothetical protein